MLDAVQCIEDRGQQTFLKVLKLVQQQLQAGFFDRFTQRQELLIGDTAIFQGGGILRPAQGQEWAGCLPGVFDKRGRCAVAPQRVQRVDL